MMADQAFAAYLSLLLLACGGCSSTKKPEPMGAGGVTGSAGGPAAAGGSSSGAAVTPAPGSSSGGGEAPNGGAISGLGAGAAPSEMGASAGGGMLDSSDGGDAASPAVTDPCGGALLCENFDALADGAQPGAPWTVNENNGSVRVSTERAFSGSNSLHCTGNAGQFAQAYITTRGAPLFPAAAAGMYGRVMLWVRDNPAGSIHWTFVTAEGRSAGDDYTAFYRIGGQLDGRLMANYWTEGNATDCWDHSATVMPVGDAGGWSCLEWRYETSTDELQFWLDGRALDDMHIVGRGEGCIAHDLNDVWEAPAAFDTLRLGWEHVANTNQRDVWLDDIAVGTSRIGCPAPR